MSDDFKNLISEHRSVTVKLEAAEKREAKFKAELSTAQTLLDTYATAVADAQHEQSEKEFDDINQVAAIREKITAAKSKLKAQKQKVEDIELVVDQASENLPALHKKQNETNIAITSRLATRKAQEIEKISGKLFNEYFALAGNSVRLLDVPTDLEFLSCKLESHELREIESKLIADALK